MAELKLETNESTPVSITLPGDTMSEAPKKQGRQVAKNGLVNKGLSSDPTPDVRQWAVDPPDLVLKGAFRGTDARSLAQKLRDDFISDANVDTITVTAPNKSNTQPEEGDYAMDNGDVWRVDPRVDKFWKYRLVMTEK